MSGRPSSFTQKTADIICERLANAESLRSICLDENMPAQTTVFRWLATYEQFRKQYVHAREAQADALFDEILDIADDGSNDWMERLNGDGDNIGWRENGEAIRRSALRVDARKWMAARLAPKKYGDKLELEHSGEIGRTCDISGLPDEELSELERILGAARSVGGDQGGKSKTKPDSVH